ncbi:hypothetical protein X805_12380 [Sphaerotilus natans subsp. natans DSM 6575]|uniref:Uncharacterized protein n=1 Tax=Sphaerotilus natans subsp. natans DSM 6575 TaxID=1286631 RepID=A0A059KNZ1_9BURK|nr:hypothetical protein X805_12380 [Sphaerotilus natans subsp. natans DSM 6575]
MKDVAERESGGSLAWMSGDLSRIPSCQTGKTFQYPCQHRVRPERCNRRIVL